MLTLLLAVLVTLGLSLSVVQANDMSLKMSTMATDMSPSSHGDCDKCLDGGASKSMPCIAACALVGMTAVPQFLAVLVASNTLDPPLFGDSLLLGRAPSPDPRPPRSSDLG
jgi:hypothetical protein